MKQFAHAFLAMAVMLMMSCSPPPETYTVKKLPDGKEIKVKNVGKVFFSEDEPALVLNYITDIPIEDAAAIETEVNSIWPVFQVNVVESGLTAGAIRAHEPRSPGIASSQRTIGFVWEKSDSGSWERVE
jgi:hypothetical protein